MEHLKHDDNDDLAIGGSRQRILNSRVYSSQEIFCFDSAENIASYQPRIFISNNFPWKSRIDQIIQNAFESGLFVKWNRKSQKPPEIIEEFEPPMEITLEQATPLFVLFYSTALGLSVLSFFAECYIFRKRKQNPTSQKWKVLESFFDGKRHHLKDLSKRR